jgi:hypothetical protein
MTLSKQIMTTVTPRSSSPSSSTSSRSNTPLSCRDFRLLYAKDAKGHDLSASYPYSTTSTSSSSSTHSSTSSIPVSCRDSLRLRYAKDGKGFDFSESYSKAGFAAEEDEKIGLVSAAAAPGEGKVPMSARDYLKDVKVVNRYARDARGADVDFEASYRY